MLASLVVGGCGVFSGGAFFCFDLPGGHHHAGDELFLQAVAVLAADAEVVGNGFDGAHALHVVQQEGLGFELVAWLGCDGAVEGVHFGAAHVVGFGLVWGGGGVAGVVPDVAGVGCGGHVVAAGLLPACPLLNQQFVGAGWFGLGCGCSVGWGGCGHGR